LVRDLNDYPGTEIVLSAGAGIRFRSPAGPVRLEYGYNLNRRKGDDAGTLHFSIGYPF
jgi:outer membrane protein insertion porin family